MAQATTISFSKLKVYLGDGATPTEGFDFPCGLNARSLNRSKNLTDIDIPDCSDEDAPAWVGREVQSLTWSVTGEGVIAEEAIEMWEAFFNGNESKSVRVEIEFAGAVGTITYNGAAHLQTYTLGANRGEKATISIDLQGDGALVAS